MGDDPTSRTPVGSGLLRLRTVGGGNDTTIWKVEILGNPVHLVIPD